MQNERSIAAAARNAALARADAEYAAASEAIPAGVDAYETARAIRAAHAAKGAAITAARDAHAAARAGGAA